jgi:DNA polymerase III subunit gamma/tau
MSYLVLARKYRPRTFEEVVGQDSVAQTLRNAITSGRVAHAYLFAGPRGVGKTTMARLLARAMNCGKRDAPTPEPCDVDDRCEPCRMILDGCDLDVIEIDGASNRGIDDVRELRGNVKFAPARSRFKIYIIDEVHMLTEPAFNALLKTLEEPPPHVMFLFATTAAQKVPETVRSRCQIFDFRRIKGPDIARRLTQICEGEGFEVPGDLLGAIAESTRGGMRDAVSLLDQVVTLAGERAPTVADLEELLGIVPSRSIHGLVDRVVAGDAAGALRTIAEIHDVGIEPEESLQQILNHLRSLLLASVCGADCDLLEVTDPAREVLRVQQADVPVERIVYMIRMLATTLRDVRLLGEGRILVEVALIKLARSRDIRALDDLRSDLDEVVERLGGATSATQERAPASPARPAKPDGLLPMTPKDAPPERTTLRSLEENWSDIVERVRAEKPGAAAFLGMARPAMVGDKEIVLSFGEDAGFHRGQLESRENKTVLEAAVQSVLGRGTRISFKTREAEAQSAAPAEAPRERQAELAARVREDPLVQRVCDTFQGRVVHVREGDVGEETA